MMTTRSTPDLSSLPSPCIGTCTIETTSQLCMGCGRSLEEISSWMYIPKDEREEIMQELQQRLKSLQVTP